MSTPKNSEESLIINFNYEFNQKKYIFSLYDIGNDSIKIISRENDDMLMIYSNLINSELCSS
jgi:hypothetical protein